MPEEKANSNPGTDPEGLDRMPEEELSDKLAEQADAVTSGLRDLLPDVPPKTIEEVQPLASGAATAAAPSETPDAAPIADEPAIVADLAPEPTGQPAEGLAEGVTEVAGEAAGAAAITSAQTDQTSGAPSAVESSSDDRLMSALAWLTLVILQLPIVSVIQLLSTTTKDRPFQRHHAITSLLFFAAAIVYEVLAAIVYTILGALTLGCGYACLWVIFFLPHALGLYYALQAYNGKTIDLPVLSNFGRQQGWL